MYNALKVKWMYFISSVSESFETKNEIHKMFFYVPLRNTLYFCIYW